MKHLKRLLKQPLREVRSSAVVALLIVAVLGFADASYLTVEHYRGVIPPCSIVEGCETVLTSPYSQILGAPVSLLGAIYYLAIALGAFMYLESRHGGGGVAAHHSAILKWTLLATALGLIMSLWFVGVMAFAIRAYCIYCLGSVATSTLLFAIAMPIVSRYSGDERLVQE